MQGCSQYLPEEDSGRYERLCISTRQCVRYQNYIHIPKMVQDWRDVAVNIWQKRGKGFQLLCTLRLGIWLSLKIKQFSHKLNWRKMVIWIICKKEDRPLFKTLVHPDYPDHFHKNICTGPPFLQYNCPTGWYGSSAKKFFESRGPSSLQEACPSRSRSHLSYGWEA